jgi:hypothetical protein
MNADERRHPNHTLPVYDLRSPFAWKPMRNSIEAPGSLRVDRCCAAPLMNAKEDCLLRVLVALKDRRSSAFIGGFIRF